MGCFCVLLDRPGEGEKAEDSLALPEVFVGRARFMFWKVA